MLKPAAPLHAAIYQYQYHNINIPYVSIMLIEVSHGLDSQFPMQPRTIQPCCHNHVLYYMCAGTGKTTLVNHLLRNR